MGCEDTFLIEIKTEHQHQVMLISWFDKTYQSIAGRLFAIPNGGHRHKVTALKMKMEGQRRGVPDLFLPVSNNHHHGLFIELKTLTGTASSEQKDWMMFLTAQGYKAVVCKGWEKAKEEIEQYLRESNQ